MSLVSHSSQVTSTLSSRTPGSGGYDLGPCWRKDQPLQVQREDKREVRMRFCFKVGHHCVFLRRQRQPSLRLSVVDVGHSRIRICRRHRPLAWPLCPQRQPSLRLSPPSTLAIVAAAAISNFFLDVGRCRGRCCRRQHQLVHLQSHCCY